LKRPITEAPAEELVSKTANMMKLKIMMEIRELKKNEDIPGIPGMIMRQASSRHLKTKHVKKGRRPEGIRWKAAARKSTK
jgi:hypothetical protein